VRSILKHIAVLCLLLTIWTAVAVVVHHHASGTETARCTVCVAAHSAAPKSTTSVLRATFVPLLAIKADTASVRQRLIAFALSVRPPPAA
jgi:hypothetical protein